MTLIGEKDYPQMVGTPHPALAIFHMVQREPELFGVILNGQGGALMLERF